MRSEMLIVGGLDPLPQIAWIDRCDKCRERHVYLGVRHRGQWYKARFGHCRESDSYRTGWKHCSAPAQEASRRMLVSMYLKDVEVTGEDRAHLFMHTRVPILRSMSVKLRCTSRVTANGRFVTIRMIKRPNGLWEDSSKLPKNIGDAITLNSKPFAVDPDLKMISHSDAIGPKVRFLDPRFTWDCYDISKKRYEATVTWKEKYSGPVIDHLNQNLAKAAKHRVTLLLDALVGRA